MKETKFTKGEWCVWGDWLICQDGKPELPIATFEPLGFNQAEGFANAHLIAAAPEMYAMIETLSTELLHMIRAENSRLLQNINSNDLDDPDYLDEESIFLAQKLLAKARGEL